MSYRTPRPSDDHDHANVCVADVETSTQPQPDADPEAFPPWPLHKPYLASVLTADATAKGTEFNLETLDLQGPSVVTEGLTRLDKLMAGRTVVGFNSRGFDMPVLAKLAMEAQTFELPNLSAVWRDNRFGRRHCDLADQFSRYGAARGASLASLCKPLSIPVKTSVAGGDVAELIAAGQYDQVATYCEEDVVATYALWLHWIAMRHSDERLHAEPMSQLLRWFGATGRIALLQAFEDADPDKLRRAHRLRSAAVAQRAADELAERQRAQEIEDRFGPVTAF